MMVAAYKGLSQQNAGKPSGGIPADAWVVPRLVV
jgi:hypothetical protein